MREVQGEVLWEHPRGAPQPALDSQGRLPGRGSKDLENEEEIVWQEQVREERVVRANRPVSQGPHLGLQGHVR